jgi:hypothetical protein
MEGRTKMNPSKAKEIMGTNFIGPDELNKIASNLGIESIKENIPEIPFDEKDLSSIKKDYILILGIPFTQDNKKLTLNKLRSHLGIEPGKSEPCFYNQDWYLAEKFAKEIYLDFKWYLIKKSVDEKSRGKNPMEIIKHLDSKKTLPNAILTAFTFFAYYFLHNKILWEHDFIWCSDSDKNGDQIYTGRYTDSEGINKKGFNIHRYLSLRHCHSAAPQIIG